MAIRINISELTLQQVVKLFSNPVPGITCQIDGLMKDIKLIHNYNEIINNIQNIRYSKSMILNALYFWEKQMTKYYDKINRIYNPLQGFITQQLAEQITEIMDIREKVDKLPDSFLFSHRYIQPSNFKDYSDDTPCALLKKKHPNIIKKDQPLWIQKGKRDIFFDIHLRDLGIHFTVFPNEHPYIPRDKISRVGMTEKGNVFVMMDKNGAGKK